jgi:dTDP-4-amino-4,6-dideoxygalactose transaminase
MSVLPNTIDFPTCINAGECRKTIGSINDLAINGAVPAFDEPLHVGKPNIGDKQEFYSYVEKIFESQWLTNNGPLVQELENKIADVHNVKHCISTCNGTIALELAIRALELRGEVIVPAYTFIATAHALYWHNIKPVFADIDADTHNIDVDSASRLITDKTTGILGVHLWGQCAPTESLQLLASEHNLHLLFDAAHAFGCSNQGVMVGNFGDAEVLSFHATKFFNTFEGGAVLTNNTQLAEKIKLMRNFGFKGKDNVIYSGTNGKMPEICAAMGLSNLNMVDRIVDANRCNYVSYHKELSDVPFVKLFHIDSDNKANYQYVLVEISKDSPISRDEIMTALHAENIIARRYFWPGCHNMAPYKDTYNVTSAKLPVTDLVAGRVLVLPTGLAINRVKIRTIVEIISTLVTGK